jgi:phage shock protein PspC (stress-responsive transcriptional regulator)
MSVYQGGSDASRQPARYAGGAWHRWQDWVNLVLGAWLFIAPWVLSASGTAAQRSSSDWDAWIVGVVIVVMALWALATPALSFPEWANVVAGVWLFLAPWILGFAGAVNSEAWTQWIVGVLVVILAAWAMPKTSQGYDSKTS